MLLKKSENKTSNNGDENIQNSSKIRTTSASNYSKKFESHFSISPTSSINQQHQNFSAKKPFLPTTKTPILTPIIRQKKILTVNKFLKVF